MRTSRRPPPPSIRRARSSRRRARASGPPSPRAPRHQRSLAAGSFTTIRANRRTRPVTARPSTRRATHGGRVGQLGHRHLGPIRRTVESDRASAQSSAAALAAARLSAQATLATDYFELRAQDQLQKAAGRHGGRRALSLKITESRYKFGVAARADVVSAETQLLSSQAQQVNAKIQRAHPRTCRRRAGREQPATLSWRLAMRTDVPTVPAGVPSTLARAPAGRSVGGAQDGRGERTDRRRQGSLLSRA
jgi:outer membrane protein TolC